MSIIYVLTVVLCFNLHAANILNTLRRNGNVLIAVDTAGRVLELSQLLVGWQDMHTPSNEEHANAYLILKLTYALPLRTRCGVTWSQVCVPTLLHCSTMWATMLWSLPSLRWSGWARRSWECLRTTGATHSSSSEHTCAHNWFNCSMELSIIMYKL